MALDLAMEALNSVDTSTSGALCEELDRIRNSPYHSFFNALLTVIQSKERDEDRKHTEDSRSSEARTASFGSALSSLSGTSSEAKLP